jgi:hypothetical protein
MEKGAVVKDVALCYAHNTRYNRIKNNFRLGSVKKLCHIVKFSLVYQTKLITIDYY